MASKNRGDLVRSGDDGYRIPTPAEDDWERQRAGLAPKPGEVSRLHADVVAGLWQPQPSQNFLGVKLFKAGLYLNGRLVTEGDIPIHLTLAEAGKEYTERVEEARRRSQTETKTIFWVSALDEAIDRETAELFRSKEILSRKERGAQTKDETALVAEEKLRLRGHQDELRRLMKQALLSGSIFFRGLDGPHDRSAGRDRRAGHRLRPGARRSRVHGIALPVIAAMVAGGCLAGWIAWRTGSLALPIEAHVGFDIPLYYGNACRLR